MGRDGKAGRDSSNSVTYHDRLAATWDARYLKGSFARRAAFFASEILPELPRDSCWLDAGCGGGFFTRMLAGGGRTVVGVDASSEMVAAAKRNTVSGGVQFKEISTIETLPFDSHSFDGVICLSVIGYLNDPAAALSEMSRVLKSGGTLVLSVPHRYSLVRFGQRMRWWLSWARRHEGASYLTFSQFTATPSSLRDDLKQNALECVNMFKFDPVVPKMLHTVLPPSLLFAVARKP